MTKLEEQELYYERLLDSICAMDEANQMITLSKMDEATSQNVMKAMIRKVNKNLNKAEKALTKMKDKILKANPETIAKVQSKQLPKKIDNLTKSIENFRNDYLTGTDTQHIWARLVEGSANLTDEQQAEVDALTMKDLKNYKKAGEYDAISNPSSGR